MLTLILFFPSRKADKDIIYIMIYRPAIYFDLSCRHSINLAFCMHWFYFSSKPGEKIDCWISVLSNTSHSLVFLRHCVFHRPVFCFSTLRALQPTRLGTNDTVKVRVADHGIGFSHNFFFFPACRQQSAEPDHSAFHVHVALVAWSENIVTA